MTQILQLTNVAVPAAPAAYFLPSSAGSNVPSGDASWNVITDSPAYAGGSSADMAVEALRGGTWVQEAIVLGYGLGSYVSDDTGQPTTVNEFTIGPFSDGATKVRLRVDRIPAGTLAALTVNRV